MSITHRNTSTIPYLCTKAAVELYATMLPADFQIQHCHTLRMGGVPTIEYVASDGRLWQTTAFYNYEPPAGLEDIVKPYWSYKAMCLDGVWRISPRMAKMRIKINKYA